MLFRYGYRNFGGRSKEFHRVGGRVLRRLRMRSRGDGVGQSG
jgi:hypothetical protein